MLLFLLAACDTSNPTGPVRGPDSSEPAATEVIPSSPEPDWLWCIDAPPVVLNELVAANHHGLADMDGDTSDWVEIALPEGEAPVDITGWALSDGVDPWALPALTAQPGAPILVFASGKDRTDGELHAAFSIDALGDDVFLHMPDGCVVDWLYTGRLYADVALGRDADDDWSYFLEPTPGAPNTTESRPSFADTPDLSPAPGFYADPITVRMTEDTVTYTTDGSVPTEASTPYGGPIPLDAVDQPVVVRARAFHDGWWPSPVVTATYSQDPSVLEGGVKVVSLTVDPPDLWDEATGIYVPGPNAEAGYPYFGANFWQTWEKDLHVEVFDTDGTLLVGQDAGIQIAGGYSRAFDQRNFELLARSGYGPSTFDAALFPDEDIDSFHRLYLRNGGDWCGTQIIDGTVQALFRDDDGARLPAVDAQAYTPVLVYLNGAFWGVYELKERLDEWYVADHHGEDPDELDRVKLGWTHDANWEVEQGDWEAFDRLDALAATDLSDPAAYTSFAAQVDVENFISATVAHGWIGNTDWWGNNIRMWRPRRDDGRWRWMVYDFGHGWTSYDYDHLATSLSGSSWRGLPLGAALANPEFRDRFVNVHADYLNTSLAGERAAAVVRELAAEVRPVMGMQRARWCGGANMDAWESSVQYAETFARRRAAAIDAALVTHMELAGHANLALDTDPPESGRFALTVVTVDAPFDGVYYQGVPVTVTAVPNPGWVFSGWSDGGTDVTITVPMDSDTALTATFVGG